MLIHSTGEGEILIATGELSQTSHAVIKLNETGARIVRLLEVDRSEEELLALLAKEYDEEPDAIKAAVEPFLKTLKEAHALI